MEENTLHLSSIMARALPSMVRNELAKMSAEKQAEFKEEYRRKRKNIGTAYLCWVLLGLHYGYFRKWGLQVVFWVTGGGLLLWWLVDLVRMPGLLSNYNKDTATEVMRNLKAFSS